MAQMMGVREQLSNFNIDCTESATIGARTQYLIKPDKKYLDGENAENSKLRKFTIGMKDPEKPNKTVLLVGETGSGKSTLVNAMLNHLMGTTYDSNEWCTIIDEKVKEKTSSQTENITVYEICAFHSEEFPYSLTIIDTPGLGDTRGLERDEQLPRVLEMLFTEEVKQIDAVGLVLQEGTNRLDAKQSYIFNSIVSLFGKDLENSIVALITHSAGEPDDTPLEALAKAGIKIARDESNEPICFLFQNKQTEASKGKKFKKARKNAWDISNGGMKDFFNFLKKVESQNLQQTAAVLTKRLELEARADSFSERIKWIEAQQREIDQINEVLKQLESGEEVTKQIEEHYKELEKSNNRWFNKTTRCTVCQENCHRNCYCWYRFKCAVIKDGKCSSCEGKCESSSHVRDKQYYVTKTRKVTVEDMVKKYEIKSMKEDLKQQLRKKEEDLARTKEKEIDEIYLCVVELDGIALKGNSIFTYKHLDFLIKKLKEVGAEKNNEKIQKLTEVKTRIATEQSEGIRYMSVIGCVKRLLGMKDEKAHWDEYGVDCVAEGFCDA